MASQKEYMIFPLLFMTALLLVPQITPRQIPEPSMRERHQQWMSDHGRHYENVAEAEARFEIFKANVEYIDSVNNAVDKPYKLSVNQFADKSNEEFKSLYTAYRKPPLHAKSASFRHENSTAIPPSIDWRERVPSPQSEMDPAVPISSIKSFRILFKSLFGAWTFPAVDAVEGITKIKGGKLYRLSSQEIVDCSEGDEGGCSGGLISDAFDFVKQKGLTTESNYPSQDHASGDCDVEKEAEAVAKISGYEYVASDDEEALMKAVSGQPVAVGIDASGSDFQFYSSGVFTGKCGSAPDHGVTVVGYGVEKGELKYWIIKNSWGTSWGEEGYMRLHKDVPQKAGMCGISEEAIYPVV